MLLLQWLCASITLWQLAHPAPPSQEGD